MSLAMFLWAPTESARNRAFWQKAQVHQYGPLGGPQCFLFVLTETACSIQARAQSPLAFETRGHAERDIDWEWGACSRLAWSIMSRDMPLLPYVNIRNTSHFTSYSNNRY
jgi:hypothetical protein